MDIVLVHGYNVTSTETYGVLPQRLKSLGYQVKHVYLSKYVTLDDGIKITDIVRAFQAALLDAYGGSLPSEKFACITHSTGGLVARGWIETYYAQNMVKLPISHLIMLSPPTNGSRLAELGKSRLSRLRSLVGIQPGLQVLDALELASQHQWTLNSDWIDQKLTQAPGFFTFVITGQWIDFKLLDVLAPATYERGSDGVVRASAANLNMQRFRVAPDGSFTLQGISNVPYLILPKTSHSDTNCGIMGSVPAQGDHPTLAGITAALAVKDPKSYLATAADFSQKTAALQKQENYYNGTPLDRYCQVVFRVTDTLGGTLHDYAIELLDGNLQGDQLPAGFFADKHQNAVNPELFVFYLDYDVISKVQGQLGFKIQSTSESPLVDYQEVVFNGAAAGGSLVRPNETTFVDVIMKRRLNKNLFRLTEDTSVREIDGKPGPDWIE